MSRCLFASCSAIAASGRSIWSGKAEEEGGVATDFALFIASVTFRAAVLPFSLRNHLLILCLSFPIRCGTSSEPILPLVLLRSVQSLHFLFFHRSTSSFKLQADDRRRKLGNQQHKSRSFGSGSPSGAVYACITIASGPDGYKSRDVSDDVRPC